MNGLWEVHCGHRESMRWLQVLEQSNTEYLGKPRDLVSSESPRKAAVCILVGEVEAGRGQVSRAGERE